MIQSSKHLKKRVFWGGKNEVDASPQFFGSCRRSKVALVWFLLSGTRVSKCSTICWKLRLLRWKGGQLKGPSVKFKDQGNLLTFTFYLKLSHATSRNSARTRTSWRHGKTQSKLQIAQEMYSSKAINMSVSTMLPVIASLPILLQWEIAQWWKQSNWPQNAIQVGQKVHVCLLTCSFYSDISAVLTQKKQKLMQ